jgi:hypothetical protein
MNQKLIVRVGMATTMKRCSTSLLATQLQVHTMNSYFRKIIEKWTMRWYGKDESKHIFVCSLLDKAFLKSNKFIRKGI